MEQLTGVIITCNYPESSADAAIPEEMTVDQLCNFIKKCVAVEKDMTSFQIVAVVKK